MGTNGSLYYIWCVNLFLRLMCMQPSMFHICSHAEALSSSPNTISSRTMQGCQTKPVFHCPFSSITSCMNVFTPSSAETCSYYAPWRLLRVDHPAFHHADHTFSHGLPLTKPQVHSSWSWKQDQPTISPSGFLLQKQLSSACRCNACEFPFSPRGIWPSMDHLSCSPCCKPPVHDFVYQCLLSERSCDNGLQKSWTVWFGAEETLGMIIVPTTGQFPGKVFCTTCTEEEFVIGQMLRCSGMNLLYLCFCKPNPFYFPSVISSGFCLLVSNKARAK